MIRKKVLIVLLALALAGCNDGGSFDVEPTEGKSSPIKFPDPVPSCFVITYTEGGTWGPKYGTEQVLGTYCLEESE